MPARIKVPSPEQYHVVEVSVYRSFHGIRILRQRESNTTLGHTTHLWRYLTPHLMPAKMQAFVLSSQNNN